MEFNFTDKVVLVTGASAGIGEATAILFAKLNAKLALVGRDEGSLKKVAERCEGFKKNKPLVVVADIGTDEGCEAIAKETLHHFGRLDVLVNNAGVSARTVISAGPSGLKLFDEVTSVNVRGVYHLTSLLVPALEASKGNIVNVSSVSGCIATIGSLPYSMSKASLDHFSRCIALELAPKGVRVNTVRPGFTESKFVKRVTGYTEEQYQAWLKEASQGIPMGRVCDADHIAKNIVFLASEHADLVTGAFVVVDGGMALAGQGVNSNILSQQMKQ